MHNIYIGKFFVGGIGIVEDRVGEGQGYGGVFRVAQLYPHVCGDVQCMRCGVASETRP